MASPSLYQGGPHTPHTDLEDSSKLSSNHGFSRFTRSRVLMAIVAVAAVVGLTLALTLPSSSSSNSNTDDQAARLDLEKAISNGEVDHDLFLKAQWDTADASTLLLFIPKRSLLQPFIVHSIFNRGTIVDGKTPDIMTINSMPVNNEVFVFHFERSLDQQKVKYVREQFSIRSSDEAMEPAMARGTYVGSEATLAIYTETEDTIVVNAMPLVQSGFHITRGLFSFAPDAAIVASESVNYPRNMNLVVHYDVSPGTYYALFFTFVPLSEKPMAKRLADDRVGYFSTSYQDLGLHRGLYQENKNTTSESAFQTQDIDPQYTIIHRRRLEVDDEGRAIQPITFYIDPSIPGMWRPYFKQGVEFWNTAFEAAGIKEAVKAIVPEDVENWPEDYQLGDLRFSTISFSVSTLGGALARGPSIIDPRSGEILGSQIVFSSTWAKVWLATVEAEVPLSKDELMKAFTGSFVHDESVDTTSLASRRRHTCQHTQIQNNIDKINVARLVGGYVAGQVPKELIGAGFADVAAHEVGHTLGLRHNFAGSLARTKDQLNDFEYTSKHGLSSSVMDYIPMNIWSDTVQLDENHNRTWFSPSVGEYDVSAIQYGYTILEDENELVQDHELRHIAAHAPDFATDEDAWIADGPYVRRYDLSADPAAYHIDRIALAKILRPKLIDRIVAHDESWVALWQGETRLLRMIFQAAQELTLFIGGAKVSHDHRNATTNNARPNVDYVTAENQFIVLDTLLSIINADEGIFPHMMDYPKYIQRVGDYGTALAPVAAVVSQVRTSTLQTLLSETILIRVAEKEGAGDTSSVSSIMALTTMAIWGQMLHPRQMNILSSHLNILHALQRSNDHRISSHAVVETARIKQMLNAAQDTEEYSSSGHPEIVAGFLAQLDRLEKRLPLSTSFYSEL